MAKSLNVSLVEENGVLIVDGVPLHELTREHLTKLMDQEYERGYKEGSGDCEEGYLLQAMGR